MADTEMSGVESAGTTSETPHCASSHHRLAVQNSYESTSGGGDSGYLTLTPRSAGMTPSFGCRSRLSSGKRPYRLRADARHCSVAAPRLLRSKLNCLINASTERDSDFPIDESSENAAYSASHDSGVFGCDWTSTGVSESDQDDTSRSFRQPENRDVATEFRERRSRGRRAWRSAAPVTPASQFRLLSPPPSPALPSASFVADEPLDEDVEMKQVAPLQSTPYSPAPAIRVVPPSLDVSPPSSSRCHGRDFHDDERLDELVVTDLACVNMKPKRLDFSRRAYAMHRTRATPDYTGEPTLDLIALLGEKSNHWRVVSKILSHLSPQDLCSFSMVSKAWRRVCANDSRANTRRLAYVILRQNTKENLKLLRKAKLESNVPTSPKSRYVRKGYLLEVQNFLQTPAVRRPPNSPPVSPSKVKFHSFVKASRTLEPWQHLLPCPSCSFPCHVDDEKNVGKCSRQGCSMEFCTACSSRPHTGPCKTPLLATPTKRNKRLIVGSRQSKRNLRRL